MPEAYGQIPEDESGIQELILASKVFESQYYDIFYITPSTCYVCIDNLEECNKIKGIFGNNVDIFLIILLHFKIWNHKKFLA